MGNATGVLMKIFAKDESVKKSVVFDRDAYVQICSIITKPKVQRLELEIVVKKGARVLVDGSCACFVDTNHVSDVKIEVEEGAELVWREIHRKIEGSVFSRVHGVVKGVLNHEVWVYEGKHRFETDLVVEGDATLVLKGEVASVLESGTSVELYGKCSVRSKVVCRGDVVIEDKVVGKQDGAKGHVECDGLLLGGRFVSKPMIEVEHDGAVITHEAGIGKIDEDALIYLMSKGMDVEQSKEFIIHSFLRD